MKRFLAILVLAFPILSIAAPSAAAEALEIRKLAEKKVDALPQGSLYWRIESFDALKDAQAAAEPCSLAVQSRDGRAWLFTLASAGSQGRGKKVAEVGPIPRFAAPEYLLRINEATGAPGATTSVHSHPGSEAFYVLDGEQSIRGPHDVLKVHAGEPSTGNGADVPMQVTSTGTADLHALVMFVLDAGKPFSTPAKMP